MNHRSDVLSAVSTPRAGGGVLSWLRNVEHACFTVRAEIPRGRRVQSPGTIITRPRVRIGLPSPARQALLGYLHGIPLSRVTPTLPRLEESELPFRYGGRGSTPLPLDRGHSRGMVRFLFVTHSSPRTADLGLLSVQWVRA